MTVDQRFANSATIGGDERQHRGHRLDYDLRVTFTLARYEAGDVRGAEDRELVGVVLRAVKDYRQRFALDELHARRVDGHVRPLADDIDMKAGDAAIDQDGDCAHQFFDPFGTAEIRK